MIEVLERPVLAHLEPQVKVHFTLPVYSWYEEAEIFPNASQVFPTIQCKASGASRINDVIGMAVFIINEAHEDTEQTVIHLRTSRTIL